MHGIRVRAAEPAMSPLPGLGRERKSAQLARPVGPGSHEPGYNMAPLRGSITRTRPTPNEIERRKQRRLSSRATRVESRPTSHRARAGVRGCARRTRYHLHLLRLSVFGSGGLSIHRGALAKIGPSPQPSSKGEGASNFTAWS